VAHTLRWARTAYEYIGLCLGYVYFGGLGLVVSFVASILHPLLPRDVGSSLGRTVIGALFRSFLALLRAAGLLRVDLSPLDALRGERGVIIAPNHPCLLDAVLVISRLPGVACIMKAQIWDNPVLGGGARLAGYPAHAGMLRQAERAAGRKRCWSSPRNPHAHPREPVQGRLRPGRQRGSADERCSSDRQSVPRQAGRRSAARFPWSTGCGWASASP
jgi:hypothetical protein